MGISRIASIGNTMMTQGSGIDIVKRQEEAAEVMFTDMLSMGNATDVNDFTADVADEMLSTVETESADTRREKPADAYEKYQYKDKTIRTETSDKNTQNAEEAVAEVKEFEEAVTEVMAEELHVSKEELEAAMEELGLTYLDLLDTKNLADLVAKLSGSENLNQLLCSETFTNVLHQVNALGAELAGELQMTPEELVEFGKVLETSEVLNAGEDVNAAETVKAETDASEDLNVEENTAGDEAESKEIRDESTEEPVRAADEQMNTAESQNAASEDSSSEGNEQNFMDSGAKQSVLAPQENVVANQVQQQTFAEQLGEFETVQPLPTYVTVADIMEQFVEQTRVLISTDTTRMEMQLNPEHLGKLYLEVVESDGVITAKLQTQNAVVKEALEMQIADLKVNLSQAGVKVDSVEVTIASHEFERNLEQDANSRKQQEDAQAKATRHRSINLNSLDELSGLMTEEETLVAKMMAEQGNSVDFTA